MDAAERLPPDWFQQLSMTGGCTQIQSKRYRMGSTYMQEVLRQNHADCFRDSQSWKTFIIMQQPTLGKPECERHPTFGSLQPCTCPSAWQGLD